MSPLQIQWDRIRRRWVLILLIGIVAAAGSLGASLLQGSTYTGRSALTIVSQDRAPEQDTVLAQGYADYFNQLSSQAQLRRTAGVDSSVGLNARIAAASPIVYIEATSDSPEVASDAATRMAVALRDDVNSGLGGDTQQQEIDQLTQQAAAAQAAGNDAEASRLQDQISDLQGQNTNQLRDLQLNAGVVADPTNAGRNAGAALVGGLLLGALLAMALGRFENRIVTPSEVRDRLGLQVLAVVGGARKRSGEDGRNEVLRSLMGLTNAHGMPVPGSLAVTGPTTTRASKTRIALSLAGLRALQGQTTLLLQTDLESDRGSSELSSMAGVADFLAERGDSRIDGKVFTNGHALLVSPPGSKRDDLFALISKSHIQRLVAQGTTLADLVIVDAPPVETVEGQVVCSAVDRSLLVVEEGETRSKDAQNAVDALGRAGGTALGVVLVRHPDKLRDPGFLAEPTWEPVRMPGPGGRMGRPAGPGGPAQGVPPQGPPRGTLAPGVPAQSGPSRPAGPGAGQVPPADRTQPISREKLEEARAAFAREDAESAAPADGDRHGAPVGKTNGAPVRAVSGPAPTAGGANGSRVDRPVPRRDDKPSAAAPKTPQAPSAPAKTPPAKAPPAKAPSAKAPSAPAAPAKPPSASTGPGAATKPAGPASPSGPATSGGQPSGPAGEAAVRRAAGGAKPSPGPKPGGTGGGAPGPKPPAGGATPGSSTASGKPAATPGSASSSPSSPPGARRIGTARFSSSSSRVSGDSARPSSGGTNGANGTGGAHGTEKKSPPAPDGPSATNGLSAPTVTLRTEK